MSVGRGLDDTTRWQTALVVALIAAGALALRLFLTWPSVFGNDYVAFIENDAWYHMRLVDALVQDFPWRIWHDPYLLHPGGEGVNAGPVLDWIIAATALVLGAGAPSPRLVDVVGACVPPVIGALTVVPVYVLGSRLFSRHAGLWAGVMVAVMPGQLLRRSLLGFTDHHCVEVLLSTTAMMFVVLSLHGSQTTMLRRRACTIAAGVALGAYLLTWGGGVLFVAIIALWAVAQLLVDAVRGAESDDVVGVVIPMLLIAAVMVFPWAGTRPQYTYQLGSLFSSAFVICAWSLLRQVWRRRAWSGRRWMVATAGVGCVAAAIAWTAMGDSAASLLADARRVSPFRPQGLIIEAQPLMASPLWRPVPLWKEFTSSLVLAVCGTGLLVGSAAIGRRSPRMALLVWWTSAMIVATFGQVRFAYYLAVNVALIGGYACDQLIRLGAARTHRAIRAMAACALFCLVAVPGVPMLRPIRNESVSLPSNWHDALTWLAINTPEPFSNPAEYYRTGNDSSKIADYGVLAWWDYGYWITRVARRVPVTNPRQSGMRDAAIFLVSSNEADANRVVERLGVRYIAVDWQLQATNTLSDTNRGFFQSIALAAGRNPFDYCGLFSEDAVAGATPGTPVVYCYPEYYRSMAMRLYLYGGRAATPAGPVVVVSHRREKRGMGTTNVVTGEWSFATYDEASRFVTSSGRPDLSIVSKHPHETCVPLEAISRYTPVFKTLDRDGGSPTAPPVVQVFEYRPHARTGR